jgi:hypothetical protein
VSEPRLPATEKSASESEFREGALTVSQIYINGFQIVLSNADTALVGLLDNQPVVKLNMSYTVAKSLVVKLGQMMATFEKAVGREIMTTDDAGSGIDGGLTKK